MTAITNGCNVCKISGAKKWKSGGINEFSADNKEK